MIFMLAFLGLIVVFAGVIPFLSSFGILMPILDGAVRYYIIIGVAIIAVIYDLQTQMLGMVSRFMSILISIVALATGVLPLLDSFGVKLLPIDLTTTMYTGAIIIIGSIALLYGAFSQGF